MKLNTVPTPGVLADTDGVQRVLDAMPRRCTYPACECTPSQPPSFEVREGERPKTVCPRYGAVP